MSVTQYVNGDEFLDDGDDDDDDDDDISNRNYK